MSLLAVADRIGKCAVIAASCAWLLAGCSGGGGSATTAAATTLTGAVTGIIEDTRTAPIAGVTVSYTPPSASLGSEVTATTGSDGTFTLSGIKVSGLSPGNADALTLTVTPPAGAYTPALLQVEPQAQVIPGSSLTFTNNFSANTGVVTLLGLGTIVQGSLISTNGTPFANLPLSLSLESADYTTTPSLGVVVNLQIPLIAGVSSDDHGIFNFSGVYDDSCVRISANAKLTSAIALPACTTTPPSNTNTLVLSTKDAPGDVVTVNNVSVTPFASGDTISPYVVSVANVVTSANPAILASTVTGAPTFDQTTEAINGGGITINFSEPIDQSKIAGICNATTCSIYVATGTPTSHTDVALYTNNGTQAPYSFDPTGQFLTIYTATPLPPTVAASQGVPATGQFVVQIPKEDVTDLTGNLMTLGANNSNTAAIPYASFVTSTSGGVFLTLNLKIGSTSN